MKENSHVFYAPDAVGAAIGHQVYLDEEESAHCNRVLRLRPGDRITLIDGSGGMYEAELTVSDRRACSATVTEVAAGAGRRTYRNHVAIAPTKNIDRFEWFVEKAVELGIDEITPLLCAHSERKVLKADRINKIMVSAVKQSGNAILPRLNEMTPFGEFVAGCAAPCKVIAHCEPQEKHFFTRNVCPGADSCALIGPEGDFSDEEIALALGAGFVPTSLGNARLRTETAGIAVCAFLAAMNNDF